MVLVSVCRFEAVAYSKSFSANERSYCVAEFVHLIKASGKLFLIHFSFFSLSVPIFLHISHRTDGMASGTNSVYSDEYLRSIEEPEEFWGEVGANMVHWDKPFEKVLDNSNPPFTKWYIGGYLNACYNAIDRHVLAGKGSKVAIIHDSPLTSTIRKVTYQELYDTVCFATIWKLLRTKAWING